MLSAGEQKRENELELMRVREARMHGERGFCL